VQRYSASGNGVKPSLRNRWEFSAPEPEPQRSLVGDGGEKRAGRLDTFVFRIGPRTQGIALPQVDGGKDGQPGRGVAFQRLGTGLSSWDSCAPTDARGLLLGFSAVPAEAMPGAVDRLSRALEP